MAISAKFLADFTDFQSGVAKAEVSLKSFEGGAGKVGASLNKMANSLTGTRLIQDATIMAEAVERVGGVSTLTAAELQRVSAQAKEAAAKLVALGQDVPPGIQRIADATKGAGAQISNMKGLLTSAAGAFGVAFSVGSVVQFGKSVFDSAAKIHDLAEQLGVSTNAAQGFKFAAEQGGSSIDAVGTAITKMNSHLAAGDKSTVKALKDAGLGFSEIRSMKPEDSFLAITDAIAKISDPMIQSDVALKLFGKSAAELLPAIKEGFRGASDGAAKMSEDTINGLEAAGDAWESLANRVTIISGTLIAGAMNASSRVTSSWAQFTMFAENAIKFGVGAAVAMADAQELAAKAAGKNKDINLALAPAVHKTAEELSAAASAAKKYADAFASMFDKFSGKAATEQMALLDAVFRKMAASGKLTEPQIDAIVKEAIKLQSEGATLTLRLYDMAKVTDALVPHLSLVPIELSKIGTQIDVVIPKADAFTAALAHMAAMSKSITIGNLTLAGDGIDIGKPQIPKAPIQGVAARLTGDFQDAMIESLRGISSDFSSVIAGDMKLSQAFKNYGTNVAKDFTASALAMIPGIGPMLSQFAGPIVDGMKKLFGNIFGIGTAGRDIVKDFAASFGGFDAFHAMLGKELPQDAERFWIMLTQGVGRNNPKEAQAAVDAITAALERQKTKTAETAQAAAAAAQIQQAALDAISEKYSGVISKLDSEYKSLSDSIAGEAEEEFMGIVEAQQRARRDQVVAEKAAQEAMRDAEIAAKKSTFEEMLEAGQTVDEKLREMFGKPMDIPYRFVAQNMPGGGSSPVYAGRATTPGEGAVHVYIGNAAVDEHVLRVVRTKTPGDLMVRGR